MIRRGGNTVPWLHAPTHQLSTRGTYFTTSATYRKAHFFLDPGRLDVLLRGVLTICRNFGWQLDAWAVFSNRYHWVDHSPATEADATSLSAMVSLLHTKTARWLNRLDGTPNR